MAIPRDTFRICKFLRARNTRVERNIRETTSSGIMKPFTHKIAIKAKWPLKRRAYIWERKIIREMFE